MPISKAQLAALFVVNMDTGLRESVPAERWRAVAAELRLREPSQARHVFTAYEVLARTEAAILEEREALTGALRALLERQEAQQQRRQQRQEGGGDDGDGDGEWAGGDADDAFDNYEELVGAITANIQVL